ncbi:hypothetical protein [Mycolicibacterium sediminis]|uniref:hypothetical protein n=1 Tax=Mycolicibacterium sediminis TaxID=1286180 RepID=UPI0013D01A46|nr:hypothetical protein [Mycolicibacterium sediminis]
MVLDVVMRLPHGVRTRSVDCSNALAALIDRRGGDACFRLGEEFPGVPGSVCEPHVSLFMLAVDEDDVEAVRTALGDAAREVASVRAEATEYRFNHEGAPEVFYARTDDWRRVQRAVVAAVEPLRRGRLRERGPGGENLADLLAAADPRDPAQVRQLREYGYDAVSDDRDDRFDPHVTLTWPRDESVRVDLSGLPEPSAFDGHLDEIGLYEMGPNGTCTKCRGIWALAATRPADAV